MLELLESIDTEPTAVGSYQVTCNRRSGRVMFTGTVPGQSFLAFTINSNRICENDSVLFTYKQASGANELLIPLSQTTVDGSVDFNFYNLDGNDTVTPVIIDFIVWTKGKN